MKQGGNHTAEGWPTIRIGRWHRQAGFTILETLIVLAVTGLLFISAVLLINGRQNKTEFTTGANNFQQQLQQIINEAASGYYGTDFSCTASAGSVSLTTGGSPSGQCLYLGKVIQFGTGPGDEAANIVTYPVVGAALSSAAGGPPNSTISGTNPVAVAGGSVDASQSQALPFGLQVAWVHYSGGTDTAAIAMLAGGQDGSFSTAGAKGLVGSQQQTLYVVPGTTAASSDIGVVTGQINTKPTNLAVSVGPVTICANSGSTSQSVIYTIAAGSLAVTSQVQNGACS